MRKHRALAGILAAIMLIGMMPSALAATVSKDKDEQASDSKETVYEHYNENKIILNKGAKWVSGGLEAQIELDVSSQSKENPVAVEFVLDATSSLHKVNTADAEALLAYQTQIEALASSIRSSFYGKNAYVGITVFGRSAENFYHMQAVPEDADGSLASSLSTQAIRWVLGEVGSNVQAGIRKGLADLNTAPENAKKYMVLVTDGGSYWWLDEAGEAANNTYSLGETGEKIPLMNNDTAEVAYSSLRSPKAMSNVSKNAQNVVVNNSTEPLAAAVEKVKTEHAYTNFETGVYWADKELDTLSGVNLITVSRPYSGNGASKEAMADLAAAFIADAVDLDTTYGNLSEKVAGMDLASALTQIAREINIVVPEGSKIVDVVGKGTDDKNEAYDFNFLKDKEVTLTVGSKQYKGTFAANGTEIVFGEGFKLQYSAGDEETLTLVFGRDIVRGEKVSLIYNAKLDSYGTASGHHVVATNVEAYLEYKYDERTDRLPFYEPKLGYTVSRGGTGETVIPDEETPKAELNGTDHYAYIIGRKDGLVHPEANITRGEVATIYFRMLTDESRAELWSQSNPYTDVQPDTWCNAAVSTMTKAGVIQGFSDGTFRPYAPITRAQFATIAVRFFEVTYSGDDKFSDIADHWAKDYINKAAEAALINGFSDGTFRPNQNITRAQAMAIFNRVLGRVPEKDHLLPGEMITWPDNMDKNAWYYANMQEATNSHEYEVQYDENGDPYEVWTKILPVRDWAAFEKEWATVNSAANPGEVISLPVDVRK